MEKTPAPEPTRETASKEPWESPAILDLPRLVDLTLQTTIPGGGGVEGDGSTVI